MHLSESTTLMKIIADENIVGVERFFAQQGELFCCPGRKISAETVKDADALLVRSVTPVDEALLKNSSIRFVGSASSGVDHVDSDYLRHRKITFHDARGCNANSVVEYVFAALAVLHKCQNINWRDKSVGIIGAGNIGGLLARKLQRLNVDYKVYDPFLNENCEFASKLCCFDEILQQDIISIHTPLTQHGQFPSCHMFNDTVIASLPAGTVIINTARGRVIDNKALLNRLQHGSELITVLDVWENEPAVELDLLKLVTIGTPHIAGYSDDGKRKGTAILYEKFCIFFGLEANIDPDFHDARYGLNNVIQSDTEKQAFLEESILTAYNILADHERMQKLHKDSDPVAQFDQLRKQYPLRREFHHYCAKLDSSDNLLQNELSILGFQVDKEHLD